MHAKSSMGLDRISSMLYCNLLFCSLSQFSRERALDYCNWHIQDRQGLHWDPSEKCEKKGLKVYGHMRTPCHVVLDCYVVNEAIALKAGVIRLKC
jgi:hypothetical protein